MIKKQKEIIENFSASLIGFAQKRSRVFISFLFFLIVAGGLALVDIPKESDPDITIPIIYVNLHLDGISAEDAEQLLVKPVERELKTIDGVKEIRSSAYDSGANVVLEFVAGFDSSKALTDVREGVDKAKSNLPSDAKEPTVNEVNLSLFPVLSVMLYGDVESRLLREVSRELKDQIEAIPEVLEAEIIGDRESLVEIIIAPDKLEGYNLNANDIITALQAGNLLVAVGALDEGKENFK